MSSKNSGGSTANDAVKHYLKNNSGWHEVRDISGAIGYDNDYTRSVAKKVANNNSKVQSRKNQQKTVIGYDINGNLEVPGGNKSMLVSLIRQHANQPPANLQSMTVSNLQSYLRNNIANGVVPLEAKLEFRWK